jgi:integrase
MVMRRTHGATDVTATGRSSASNDWRADPQFLAAIREDFEDHYAFTFLGFTTGLRPSSLRPLRREGPNADLKWAEGVLLIRRSHTIGNEVMETTKTDLHQRLALPLEALDVLRWHVDAVLHPKKMRESELLFPAVTGGFRACSCLDKPFAEVAKKIGLGYRFTPRGMRRTYQDLARAAGIHDAVGASQRPDGHRLRGRASHQQACSITVAEAINHAA